MDIYEALGKLRENKKVDRVAQRKKLVENKLAESDSKKPVKKLNESSKTKKVGNKPLKEGIDDAENVDQLIYEYLKEKLTNSEVYCEDVMGFLERCGLDPDYIYEYDIEDTQIEFFLEQLAIQLGNYYVCYSHSPNSEKVSWT